MKSLGLTLCAWIAAGFLTFPSAFSPEKSPQWPLFQKHLIDAGASESAAVADINRDARLNIISGENWYEAPEWKKRQLREINPNYGNSNEVVWREVVKGEFVRRSIGNDNAGWQGFLDNNDVRRDRDRSEFDVDHRLVSSFVYELPYELGRTDSQYCGLRIRSHPEYPSGAHQPAWCQNRLVILPTMQPENTHQPADVWWVFPCS
jgi:hypothetical protein